MTTTVAAIPNGFVKSPINVNGFADDADALAIFCVCVCLCVYSKK